MKAELIELTHQQNEQALELRATVRLTSGWFARRSELVDLVATERRDSGEVRWRSATTGRDLREMRHGALIRDALERRPVVDPTVAIARDTEPRIYSRSGCRFEPCDGDGCDHDRGGYHCADCGDGELSHGYTLAEVS